MKLFTRKGFLQNSGLFLLGLFANALGKKSMAADATSLGLKDQSDHEVGSRIRQIERTWLNEYRTFFASTTGASVLAVDQITTILRRITDQSRKQLALIYIFPHDEELEVLLVIPGESLVRKTFPQAPKARFQSTIQDFQSKVARAAGGREYLSPANQIYQWVIAPLEASLQAKNIDTLIFCAGEGVRSLPFAALHDGQQFLIEKYSVGLIPAFSLTNPNYSRLQNTQVLAMGASEFKGLSALPAVPLELSAILQGLWQGKIFLNQAFTLRNLRRQLSSRAFSIVHLATHAEFRPGASDNSYIQLWQDDQIRLNQLRQLDWEDLPVELLVLSACQTALGDEQAELGFAGLSFESGVKSSLASLWRVSDLGTLALMREFYRQLADTSVTTKAEALRKAQIAMLKKEIYVSNSELHGSGDALSLSDSLEPGTQIDFARPYYWAAFTLVGSPW